jgi:hypothetical protein
MAHHAVASTVSILAKPASAAGEAAEIAAATYNFACYGAAYDTGTAGSGE